MRLSRPLIVEWFEMVILDHQGFTMLFQKEADLCCCRRIVEQESVFHHLVEIEELNRLQGTPYFFPASRKVRSAQDIYQRPLQTGNGDFQAGAVNSDDTKFSFPRRQSAWENFAPRKTRERKMTGETGREAE